jgi:hypothetical protein
MAETPPEKMIQGIGLGNKAYGSFGESNVMRITFPAIVVEMENGFVTGLLNFVRTSPVMTSRAC